MNDRYLETSTVSVTNTGSATSVVPKPVREILGDPDRVAWFLDEETGRIFVVPDSEVTVG